MLTQERLTWLKDLIRQDKVVKFYQWSEWRKLRQQALKRDNYECQTCKRDGKYAKAQNVHHLKEVKQHPELALTLSNLECICITCHNKEHERLEKTRQVRFTNKERW